MYNKFNIMIKEFCYKGGDRPVLSTILFDGKRSLATDSHILAQVTTPDVNVEDVPEGLGTVSTDHKVQIPYSVICKIEKNLPKNQSLPILQSFFLTSKNGSDEPSWIAMTDLESPLFFKINPSWSENKFPDTDKLFSKEEPVAKISLNPLLLEKMCRVAKNFGSQVTLTLRPGWNKPLMFESTNDNKQELRGLIMPLREPKVEKWYEEKKRLAEAEIPKEAP